MTSSYKVRPLSPAGQGEEPSPQRGTEEEGLGGKEEAGRVRAVSQAPDGGVQT